MPRNTAGTYTAPSGNPVSAGSVIRSNWANTTVQDLGGEITNSLSRDGYGAMRAPLKVPDGSNAAPTYTFTNDPDSGTFLQSAGHVGMAITSTLVQLWTAATTTISNALSVAKGLTVTNSTTNGAGATVTGNGTGAGLVATGGATGSGGTFAGGATSGAGIVVTGGPTSNGATITGGGTSGLGLSVTAGAGNANAINALATGTGHGLSVTAPGSGNAVDATSSTGRGVKGTGYYGGDFTGTTGQGVLGTGAAGVEGGYFSNGTAATGSTRRVAVTLANGDLSFGSTTNPDSTLALSNMLTPKNIVKTWARIATDGASGVSVGDGFGISSVAISGDVLTITWATAFASINYAVVAVADVSSAYPNVYGNTTTTVSIQLIRRDTGALYDLDANVVHFMVIAVGAQ